LEPHVIGAARAAREPSWSDALLWMETVDALIRGLGHALNNRALALSATLQSLDARRAVGSHTSSALMREAERLTAQLRHLRTLPFAAASAPMPLLPRDVLSTAIRLHQCHAHLGDVSCYLSGSAETPPMLVSESVMTHATLVQLTTLKQFVAPHGVVRVQYAGSANDVRIRFIAEQEALAEPRAELAQALLQPVSLVAALLARSRGHAALHVQPGRAEVVWTLPSLRAMRRQLRAEQTMA
jgi:hypothetical protein